MAATASRALTVTCAARHVAAAAGSGVGGGAQNAQWAAKALESKPLSELRALAKQRGLRGDTKAEIIALLTSSGGGTVATSAPAPAPSASAGGAAGADAQRQRQLDVLPLAQLRAMARSRGLAATGSKAQLIRDLLIAELSSTSATPPPPPPTTASPSASASAPTPTPLPAAPASPTKSWKAQLQAQPLSALRALARERGLGGGDTRAELITALSLAPPAGSEIPGLVPNLPASFDLPFQSEVLSGGSALAPSQASQLAAELAALQATMQALQSGQAAVVGERDSLREQADLLRNVLVGGLGLALVPLLLQAPLQQAPAPATAPAAATAAAGTAQPLPGPEVRELAPEEFCRTLPASLLSPQLARFCQAVNNLNL